MVFGCKFSTKINTDQKKMNIFVFLRSRLEMIADFYRVGRWPILSSSADYFPAVRHTPPFGHPSPRGDGYAVLFLAYCYIKRTGIPTATAPSPLGEGCPKGGVCRTVKTSPEGRFCIADKLLIASSCSARCTVYVQYMYSMCTLPKRTNTVHILYIYCTTDGEGGFSIYVSGVYDVVCVVVRHCVPLCVTGCRSGIEVEVSKWSNLFDIYGNSVISDL